MRDLFWLSVSSLAARQPCRLMSRVRHRSTTAQFSESLPDVPSVSLNVIEITVDEDRLIQMANPDQVLRVPVGVASLIESSR
jgi:hypothetical protein